MWGEIEDRRRQGKSVEFSPRTVIILLPYRYARTTIQHCGAGVLRTSPVMVAVAAPEGVGKAGGTQPSRAFTPAWVDATAASGQPARLSAVSGSPWTMRGPRAATGRGVVAS
jgi:hypothetical protein